MSGPTDNEPAPKPGTTAIADLVIADIDARVEMGHRKYGTKLQAHNGRDALWDLYQELIDAVMYTRQVIAEKDDADRLVSACLRYLSAVGNPEPNISDFATWLDEQTETMLSIKSQVSVQ